MTQTTEPGPAPTTVAAGNRPTRLGSILAWVGIVVGVVLVVAVIFVSGFIVGRGTGGNFGDAPTMAQPLYCQALCVGETNVSQQAWADCISRCMSTGGVG
jgi:hypothetical protein